MPVSELRKQISIFLPLSEWRALREEAARNGIPITELCRRWMAPHIAPLAASRVDPTRSPLSAAPFGRRP